MAIGINWDEVWAEDVWGNVWSDAPGSGSGVEVEAIVVDLVLETFPVTVAGSFPSLSLRSDHSLSVLVKRLKKRRSN